MSTLVLEPQVIRLGPLKQKMSDNEYYEFCQLNRDWRIEQSCDGEIIIMPPTGGETGRINSELNFLFVSWAKQDGTGITFDSSTEFVLPNSAKRSPDASWVKRTRWDTLTKEQREKFPPLCPDFVVELRSPSDSLSALQAKMQEYITNGAQLGWLIDPSERKIYIYRPNESVKQLDDPQTISGDPVLRGLVLEMKQVWG